MFAAVGTRYTVGQAFEWCLGWQAVSPTRGQTQAERAGTAVNFYLLCDVESKRKSVNNITALKARNLPKSGGGL
jgi:hypothetical protein